MIFLLILKKFFYRCPARRPRNSALNASGRGSRNRHHQPRKRVAPVCQISSSQPASAAPTAAAAATVTSRVQTSSSSSSSSSSDDDSDEETSSSSSSVKTSDSKGQTKTEEEEDCADAMQTRLDWKLALLYTLLVLQVLVVMIYVTSTPHMSELNAPASQHDTVSFVDQIPQVKFHRSHGYYLPR